MSEKAKKVLNVIVNVIIVIIVVIVLLLAINIIASKSKGYTSVFGKAFLVVQSDSMKGDLDDDFEKGDLIVIDVLSDEEKQNLEVGTVITFYANIVNESTTSLNSHRIYKVEGEGASTVYYTKGDNNEIEDQYVVSANAVVGTFVANWGRIGVVINWMSSSTGYFVCIVIPSFLVVAYFAVNLVLVIRDNKRAKALENGDLAEMTPEEREAYKEKMKADMEAEVRAKVLAEMQAEQNGQSVQTENTETADNTEASDGENNSDNNTDK